MSKLINLTNNKYGRLTVLYKDANRITKSGSYWICQCQCGNNISVKSSSLRNGSIQSCGCLRKEKAKAMGESVADDLIGNTYGLLTVISKSEIKGSGREIYWNCVCQCGNLITVRGQSLKRKDENRTISCGCSKKSFGEIIIANILKENSIEFIEQYRFLDFNKMPYDFAIIKNNKIVRLIEFDGEQHFKDVPYWNSSLNIVKERDKRKNLYAKENKIPLIRIPYWERDNISLEMLMGDKYLI